MARDLSIAAALAALLGGPLTVNTRAAEPAPVNPYNGMQERKTVFAFTQKPQARKKGDTWIITFASKAACDATVAVLDKSGKVVRHVASGVLGINAPHPFQQGSLRQRIEWDGLTDDCRKARTFPPRPKPPFLSLRTSFAR